MAARAHKYRILVVDDEPSVLLTYQMILHKERYQVIAAASFEAACRALDTEEPSLLLCDLSLGENGSGFQVIEYARRRLPGLPSVLLTGYASREVTERARAAGVAVLLKPIGIQEFLGVIRAHLTKPDDRKAASGQ